MQLDHEGSLACCNPTRDLKTEVGTLYLGIEALHSSSRALGRVAPPRLSRLDRLAAPPSRVADRELKGCPPGARRATVV